MKRIRIFDTTLRDGEQSPGFNLTPRRNSHRPHLEQLGVDIIEAGFPILVRATSKRCAPSPRSAGADHGGPRPRRRADIDRAWRGVWSARRKAPHSRVSRDLADPSRSTSCARSRERSLERPSSCRGGQAVRCDDVEFSAEDATRSDWEFLEEVVPGGDRGRRDDDQRAGHGRLRARRRLRPDVRVPAGRTRRGSKRSADQRPLPRRPGPGGRQLAGGGGRPARRRWSAPSTASASARATPAGRDRHGAAGPQRPLQSDTGIVTDADLPHQPAGQRRSPASPCSPTRRSSARTPSPTSPASTRTAC